MKELLKNEEICHSYYKDHNLDSAMVYVKKIREILAETNRSKIEGQVNIAKMEKFINQVEV